jgi:hypothetical protein
MGNLNFTCMHNLPVTDSSLLASGLRPWPKLKLSSVVFVISLNSAASGDCNSCHLSSWERMRSPGLQASKPSLVPASFVSCQSMWIYVCMYHVHRGRSHQMSTQHEPTGRLQPTERDRETRLGDY